MAALAQKPAVARVRLWGNAFGHGAAAAVGALVQSRAGRQPPLDVDLRAYWTSEGRAQVACVAAED